MADSKFGLLAAGGARAEGLIACGARQTGAGAEFGVDGFYCRQEHHYIYWRLLSDGVVGIVTVFHERMH